MQAVTVLGRESQEFSRSGSPVLRHEQ
jgi:hypothetical protein